MHLVLDEVSSENNALVCNSHSLNERKHARKYLILHIQEVEIPLYTAQNVHNDEECMHTQWILSNLVVVNLIKTSNI